MEDPLKLKYELGYEFSDLVLLREALTHRSYSAENALAYDNQRLEYLGDAVLEIILSEYLYRRYPTASEGLLTKMRAAMVRQDALAALAGEMHLDRFIRMGRGEIEAGGMSRDSTLCDVFEALVGAVYLDSGLVQTRELFMPWFDRLYPDPEGLLSEQNPKGTLQELSQRRWGCAPEYQVIEVTGPDHDPVYRVRVTVRNQLSGEGVARKRKTAESAAAGDALKNFYNGAFKSEEDRHD